MLSIPGLNNSADLRRTHSMPLLEVMMTRYADKTAKSLRSEMRVRFDPRRIHG